MIVIANVALVIMVVGFSIVGAQLVALGNKIDRLDAKTLAKLDDIDDNIDTNYASLNNKLDGDSRKLNNKLDAITQQLAEEFRATQAVMAAQTAAITVEVAVAKRVPLQVLLIPTSVIEAPAANP